MLERPLDGYGGTVLRTSLSREQEQELMKALDGDDPSAPTWEQSPAPSGARLPGARLPGARLPGARPEREGPPQTPVRGGRPGRRSAHCGDGFPDA